MSGNLHNFVVDGEASESDIDDSIDQMPNVNTGHGVAVDGEAPESDEEIVSYSRMSVSDATEAIPGDYTEATMKPVTDSVLQKKLSECNANLWKHLNQFIQRTILNASKHLITTEHLQIKSQVVLQQSSMNWKAVNKNTRLTLDKIRDIVSVSFIPAINIK